MTMDQTLRAILRSDRRRRMAEELATWVPTDEEQAWIAGSTAGTGRILVGLEGRPDAAR